jgi:hypothetical protein
MSLSKIRFLRHNKIVNSPLEDVWMKREFLWGEWASLLLLLPLISVLLIFPFGVEAQSLPPKLESLSVALWPEYDQPEVLIIYRAELSAETTLPVELTFRLPGYIDEMHAVAIYQGEGLVDVNPDTIQLIHEGDDLLLAFPTSSARIQFEYYDPVILTRQNQVRQFTYDFSAPYSIETATFEVQQPFQAESFSLSPAPDNTFAGNDGLQYNTIRVANLTQGQTFELSATYQRSTDEVTAQSIAGPTTVQLADISTAPSSSDSSNNQLGYILIGAGAVLLLGTGGYWWLRQNKAETARQPVSSQNSRRRTRQKSGQVRSSEISPSIRSSAATEIDGSALLYCYRCGAALLENANFCHACGAEVRR